MTGIQLSMIEFVHPAKETDAEPMFNAMNRVDRVELSGLTNYKSVAVLQDLICRSGYSFCATIDGEPIALGGVILKPGSPATAWMVANSDMLYRRRWAFLRASLAETARMRAFAPGFITHVDRRWGKSLKWLKWLGFNPVGEFEISGRFGVILAA